jgi:hypothetical protein
MTATSAMKRMAMIGAVAGSLALPAAASADVLVNAAPCRLVCGDAIRVGIFAQIATRGNRTVRIRAVDDRTGVVFWRRTATAHIGRWRYWSLPSGRGGQCGATTIVYQGRRPDGSSWTGRFHVHFRGEGV